MKENSIKNERSSIEEYVKILEKFSNENVIYGSTVGMTLEKYKDLQLSAEHILSDYKRVLKENEELEEINNELEAIKDEAIRRYNFESIPVSLVEEKIEELDKEKLKYDNDLRIYTLRNTFDFQKEVLQELLEKRK